ncbi:MAG TPA: outer membrane lipoprotein-sorting protein [Candidatus Fraserbacteria bacterium]|nr:outer membrane lipoprotein-sorting protein [Candidatus Fraserbacteria bacterium]
MRPILWLLVAALAILLGWLTITGQAPPAKTGEKVTTQLAQLERGQWLVGPGMLFATVHLSTWSEPGGEPVKRKKVVLISTATKTFQGLIVGVVGGAHWLRRGQELYRLLPGKTKVTQVKDRAVWQAPFAGSALSVAEFLVGFQLERYDLAGSALVQSGEREMTLLARPDSQAPYARLEVYVEAQGKLQHLKAYDTSGRLLKTVKILAYTEFQHTPLIKRLVVEDVPDSLRTEVLIQGRKPHSLPDFAFTPQTMSTLQIGR